MGILRLVHELTQSGSHLGIFVPERLSYRLSADLVVSSAIMQPRLMSSMFPVTGFSCIPGTDNPTLALSKYGD